MVFCNGNSKLPTSTYIFVTILILIDGFLQYKDLDMNIATDISHNPYFNRWFSAIKK